MSPDEHTVASSLRHLKFRHLGREAYLREMVQLADIGDGSQGDDIEQFMTVADRFATLRSRVALLEEKVRGLEAQK